MRRRLVATLLSSLCLITATAMLVAFIKLYTVPHTLTNIFQPRTCRVVAIDCGGQCDATGGIGVIEDTGELESQVANDGTKENQVNLSIIEPEAGNQGDLQMSEERRFEETKNDDTKNKVTNTRTQGHLHKHGKNRTLSDTREHIKKDLDVSLSNVSFEKGVVDEDSSGINRDSITNGASDSDIAINQKNQHLKIVHKGLNSTSVRTKYKSTEHRQEDFNLPELDMTVTGRKCCQKEGANRCDSIFVDVTETDSIEQVPLIENPWIYYDMVTSYPSLLCTCPSCRVSVHHHTIYTIDIGGSTYTEQEDTFPCYVNTFGPEPEVLLYKMSTLVVLNLMFWPTLFFMVGFVGLFFSCLYLQYEECTDNWCARTLRL